MKIAWVIANNTNLPPKINSAELHDAAPMWGSWRTWRAWQTDNVICHTTEQAMELVHDAWWEQCNLYVSETVWMQTGKLPRVNAYGGVFDFDLTDPEDIIAMHLAASQNQVVILLGYEFATPAQNQPAVDRWNLCVQAVRQNPDTQWVWISKHKPAADLQQLKNFTCDSLENVLQLLTK